MKRINVAASTKALDVDNRISLRYYFRIADNILKQANIFRAEKNYIDLYIMLLRFSSLVTETIARHRDYKLSSQSEKNYLKKKTLEAVIELERLKPTVERKIELSRKHNHHKMAGKARMDDENDAILDLACYCDQMSVTKTHWFGPNAGRRFRACWNNTCGYQEWIDEEPLGPRTLEIIKELQERAFEREEKYRRRMVRMRERHQAEMNQLKTKQQCVVVGLFVLVNLMMNMVLNTIRNDTVVEEDDYDSLDE